MDVFKYCIGPIGAIGDILITATSDINKGINIVTLNSCRKEHLQRYKHVSHSPVEFNDSPCV